MGGRRPPGRVDIRPSPRAGARWNDHHLGVLRCSRGAPDLRRQEIAPCGRQPSVERLVLASPRSAGENALMIDYQPSDVAWMCSSATLVGHLTVPTACTVWSKAHRSRSACSKLRSSRIGASSATFPEGGCMRRYLLHLRREGISGLGEVLAANENSINTEPVQVARVSDGFFRTLRVTPALGRYCYSGKDNPGSPQLSGQMQFHPVA
jgi:hypothetical protein